MKNLFKKIALVLSLALSISTFSIQTTNAKADSLTKEKQEYVLDSSQVKITGLENIQLDQNETIQIPLNFTDEYKNKSRAIFEGAAGYLELTVSGSYVNYKIVVNVPVTHFVGTMNITNLTSGLGSGTTPLGSLKGSVFYNRYTGHNYGASVSGDAYFGPLKVAYTGDNYITWRG